MVAEAAKAFGRSTGDRRSATLEILGEFRYGSDGSNVAQPCHTNL
jgi:hypothetical protein